MLQNRALSLTRVSFIWCFFGANKAFPHPQERCLGDIIGPHTKATWKTSEKKLKLKNQENQCKTIHYTCRSHAQEGPKPRRQQIFNEFRICKPWLLKQPHLMKTWFFGFDKGPGLWKYIKNTRNHCFKRKCFKTARFPWQGFPLYCVFLVLIKHSPLLKKDVWETL